MHVAAGRLKRESEVLRVQLYGNFYVFKTLMYVKMLFPIEIKRSIPPPEIKKLLSLSVNSGLSIFHLFILAPLIHPNSKNPLRAGSLSEIGEGVWAFLYCNYLNKYNPRFLNQKKLLLNLGRRTASCTLFPSNTRRNEVKVVEGP